MGNWFKALLKGCEKALDYMIEEVSLSVYVGAIVVVIVGCGVLYTFLTPHSHGIANKDDVAISPCTIFDGLYFSIVTLSSLGYGEYHPMGASRAIACTEVLFGLAWLGTVIAKITSRRLSYHVQRLFSSDAQKRLEDLIARFEAADQSFQGMRDEFPVIPGNGYRQEDKARVLVALRTNVALLHTASSALGDYISYEAQHAGYFTVTPTDPIRRLEKIVGDVLVSLSGVVISMAPGHRAEFLEYANWKRLAEIFDSHKKVGSAITEQSKDLELRQLTTRVNECCEDLRKNYFATPVSVPTPAQPAQPAQPDQVSPGATAPQEFMESGQ